MTATACFAFFFFSFAPFKATSTDSHTAELDELEAREANEDKTISTDSLNVEDILNKVNPPDSSIDGGNLEDYKGIYFQDM